MQVRITGTNIEIQPRLREFIQDKLQRNVTKYFENAIEAEVHFSKQAHIHHASIIVNDGIRKRHVLTKAKAESEDIQTAFNKALDKIEKQLRRYKRKIKNHHTNHKPEDNFEVAKRILTATPEEELTESHNPVIVEERQDNIERLTVADAVMRLELLNIPALMFINKKTNHMNVVYHREDGNISWVESNMMPQPMPQFEKIGS